MSKLKIYMCSGVGDTRDSYAYWLDDTKTVSNTRAVNSLLARINELCAELDYMRMSQADQIRHFNDIDILVIALQFAKKYTGDNESLKRAGFIIQDFINEGKFSLQSTNDTERGDHLDSVYAAVCDTLARGATPKVSGDFVKWWLSFVIPNNRQGLTPTEQSRLESALKNPKGVGDSEAEFKRLYGDIGVYLYNASDYFLYTWIPADKVKRLPYFLRKKVDKQREVYRYVLQVFEALYGGEEDMRRILRTRIIAQCGHTPEDVVDVLLGSRGIGDFGISEIIMIIIIAVAATLAILSAIIQAVQNVLIAKYAVPENIEDGCPEETDWPAERKSNLIKIGAIGLLLYFLFK